MRQVFYRITFLLIVLGSVSFSSVTRAQQDSTLIFKKNIEDYLKSYPEEKLFVHISKPHFVTGETLWFRIYHLSSLNHQPMPFSKVAYVDIIGSDGKSVIQEKVKINESGGDGSIYLSTDLNSGVYRVVAYTKWMRNFDPSLFFSAEITVINPFKRLNLQANNDQSYDVQFFPEGGHLIKGINSRIAFKGLSSQGKGFSFKGFLLHEKDTVTSFISNRFGMGSFDFQPESSYGYSVILEDDSGKSSTFPAPPVQEEGYAMRIQRMGEEYKVSVDYSGLEQPDPRLYLAGISRGEFLFIETAYLRSGKLEFDVSFQSLNEGINQLTLFNHQGIPICERKIFKYPEDRLRIDFGSYQKQYSSRQPVKLEILTTDLNQSPVTSDLSLSVYRSEQGLSEELADIQSYLWLLSELEGNIENPGYYFKSTDQSARADMDLLMLTQGWSKYNIGEILNGKSPEPEYLPEFVEQTVSANITNKGATEGISNQLVSLSIPNSFSQYFISQSDINGNLFFELEDIYGNTEMILRYNSEEDLRIEVNNSYTTLDYHPWSPFMISPDLESFIIEQSINMQVENIFNQAPSSFPGYDSASFYGVPDAMYYLDDFTRFPVMEEVMREYVYGVNVRKVNKEFTFKVLDLARNEIMQETPLVLLDGVPIFNIDNLMEVDPLLIQRIEVVHRQYFYGPSNCSGIVAFYSYDSSIPGVSLDEKTIKLNYKGFQDKKEFYKPVYSTPEIVESRNPDFRNQLHWEPYIITDDSGKATIQFYTSDSPGTYRIVIQGVSENGLPGSFESEIVVK